MAVYELQEDGVSRVYLEEGGSFGSVLLEGSAAGEWEVVDPVAAVWVPVARVEGG